MIVKIICTVCGMRFGVAVLRVMICPNSRCKNDNPLEFRVAENQTIPAD